MESFQNLFVPFLRRFFPVSGADAHQLSDGLVAFLVFISFMLVGQLLAWLMVLWLKRASRTSENGWLDDELVVALRAPLRLLPLWFGLAAANESVHLTPRQELMADHLVLTVGGFIFFWALFNAMRPISKVVLRFEGTLTRPVINWIRGGLQLITFLIGSGSILNIWGIQIGGILAGLGIFGAAVALGAQDLFKNLIAGILILSEKRFDIGDWILVEKVVEGDVERIGFRSTLVRRFDKAPVYVPNTKLSDDAVTNFSRMTFRRIQWTLSVDNRASLSQIDAVCADILHYLSANPDFVPADNAGLFVGIDKFSENGLDLQLLCFTTKIRWAEFVVVKAALGARVKQIMEQHGVAFAVPTTTLYMPGMMDQSDARPERTANA